MAVSNNILRVLGSRRPPSSVRIAYHTAFWIILVLLLLLVDMAMFDGIRNWGLEIVSLSFFFVIVYLNLLYLIPNYLTKEKFLTYIGLLLASALTLSSFRFIVFFLYFNNDPSIEEDAFYANLGLYLPLTVTVAGGSTILKIMADWFRQLREKQELATQTMQSELRFLKSQINPHFLFNTLNNLYALTLKKSDKAPEIVIKLSEMMRYMLYECNEKRVPLHKEVNYLRNYLDLERLRQHDKIEINFLVEGRVGDQEVAPLLFIPFLENSFKHGLNTQLAEGFVNIMLSVNEGYIDFQIENSKGQTVPRPDNRPSGGIGLVNVRRRLDLLYPERYELKVSNNPNTFSVHLTVDLAE